MTLTEVLVRCQHMCHVRVAISMFIMTTVGGKQIYIHRKVLVTCIYTMSSQLAITKHRSLAPPRLYFTVKCHTKNDANS